MTTRQRSLTSTRAGFSLVEISIVMVIVSVIMTGGLLASANFMQRQAYVDSEDRLNAIFDALRNYHGSTGRLPCPASLTVPLGGAGFAVEADLPGVQTGSDCHNQSPILIAADIPAGTHREPRPAINNTSSLVDAVRIGAVPTRILGLPDDHIADGFGNRFIYAVTEPLTNTEKFGRREEGLVSTSVAAATPVYTGQITITDANNTISLNDAAFVVVAPGLNGRKNGAFRYVTGNGSGTCGLGGRDDENCDFNDTTFRESPFNDGDETANYFDDLIRYTNKDLLAVNSLANIASECKRITKGIMRRNSSGGTSFQEYCDGLNWRPMEDSSGFSGVECYAFEEGKIRIDPDTVGTTNQLQECDGDIWVNFP